MIDSVKREAITENDDDDDDILEHFTSVENIELSQTYFQTAKRMEWKLNIYH